MDLESETDGNSSQLEVHRQRCQQCGSIDVRNVIAREPGRAQMVYVICSECHELVARYRLSGYYHHGKGLESYLRSMGSDASDSARGHLQEFGKIKEESLEGAQRVLEQLEDEGKSV